MTRAGLTTLVILLILIIGATIWYWNTESQPTPLENALAIARNANSDCAQKGTVLGTGTYNANSETWWLDFTPLPQYTQNLCNPACVVSINQGTAEINWRCTGAIPPATKDDLVALDSPLPNAMVRSPLTITGRARGNWYFEASFPVKLYDSTGKLIAQAPAQAQGEWMTTEYVPFRLTLTFTSATATGTLVLEKDNPSGLPQNANELRIPVIFSTTTSR